MLFSLARKGDEELMQIFTASWEGEEYSIDSFDSEFFIMNIQDIVRDRLAAEKEEKNVDE